MSNNIEMETLDLSIEEIEINKKIFGYIFKFIIKNKLSSLNSSIENEIITSSKIKKNYSFRKSNVSNKEIKTLLSSPQKLTFSDSLKNNNNIFNIPIDYIPNEDKVFYIDIKKKVFFQNNSNLNYGKYENEIKQLANDFFNKNKSEKNNSSQFNTEESYSSETENYTDENSSILNSKIENNNFIKNNILENKNILYNNNDFDDYYHVDLNNIRLSIYNYNKQICIETKKKELISEKVKERMDEEKNHVMLNLISNKNNNKKKLKKTISIRKEHKLLSKEILNSYDNKNLENLTNIFKKQIIYSLKKKDNQGSVFYLSLFSNLIIIYLIFQVIIEIYIYIHFYNKIEIYQKIIINSNNYLKNLVTSVYKVVRELIISNSKLFENAFGLSREEYFSQWKITLSITFQEMVENKLFIEKYSSLFNKDSYYKIFNENTKIFFINNEYNVNEYYI